MQKGFLQKNAELFGLIFRLADLSVIVFGGLTAYWLRFDQLALQEQYQFAIALATVIALVVFPAFGLYQPWRGASLWQEIEKVSFAWISIIGGCMVLTYLSKTGTLYSRLWFGSWVAIVFAALILARLIIRLALRRLRRKGHNTRQVVILGAGELGRRVARTLESESWAGLKVVGFFDDDEALQGTNVNSLPVLGTLDEVSAFVDRTREFDTPNGASETSSGLHADQAWIALPLSAESRIRETVAQLNHTTVNLHFVPDIFGYALLNHSMDEIAGIPVLNLSTSPIVGRDLMLKEIEDRILALLFLLVASPLMTLIAILVKLESSGPIIFKQRRYGLDGQEILVWKFRTMKVCEDGTSMRQATRDDPRLTRLGAFLRRSSFDELPQLVNVLQGTMSLVGPRPHPVALNEQYRGLISHYMVRHKIKPGITGWAQVNGWRGETETLELMEKRIEYDMWYMRNWSLWLDLKLIIKTVFVGFGGQKAY